MKKVIYVLLVAILACALVFTFVGCKKNKGSSDPFKGNYKEATASDAQAILTKLMQLQQKVQTESDCKITYKVVSEGEDSDGADIGDSFKLNIEATGEVTGSLAQNTIRVHGKMDYSYSEKEDGISCSSKMNEETWANYAQDIAYTSITSKETYAGQTASNTEKYSSTISKNDGYIVEVGQNLLSGQFMYEAAGALTQFIAGSTDYKVSVDGDKCKIEYVKADKDYSQTFYIILSDNKISFKSEYAENEDDCENVTTTITIELGKQTVKMPNAADYPAKEDK